MRPLTQFIHHVLRPQVLALGFAVTALAATAMFAVGSAARPRTAKPVQSGRPVLKTDKAGYLAGEIVTITGSGFAPLESVMLQVKHADGTAETGFGHEPWWVYPDANGTFKASWSIKLGDSAGAQFAVSASAASGATAVAAFGRTATISVNPFAIQSEGTATVTAGGFNPNELLSIQAGRNPPEQIRADESGRATVQLEVGGASSDPINLSARSLDLELVAFAAISSNDLNSNGWFSVVDNAYAQDGAPCSANPPGYCQDDVPLEKDLTRMGRNDTDATKYKVFMSWNSVTSWTGVGQTGNACALFSNRADGKIQFVACAAVENDPNDATRLRQVAGSPYAFSCNPSKNDRCAQPSAMSINSQNPEVAAGEFGTLLNTGSLVTSTDPFPTAPGDPDDVNKDTTIEIDIAKSFLPASNMTLVNVCSYPSAGNGGNNNPFDCVVRPASGFLQITKIAPTGATQQFQFDVKKGNSALSGSPFSITGGGSAFQQAIAVDLGADYSVVERAVSGWQLDNKSCTIQGSGSTGSGLAASNGPPATFGGLGSVEVRSGLVTTCTFTDSQLQPKLTLIKNVINDNGGAATADSWTLSATGTGGFTNQALNTITTESGYTSSASTGKQSVTIAVQYSLSESAAPAGYSNNGNTWTCSGGTFTSPNLITLAAGEDVTCRIVNNDIAPTLTLIKNVKNDNGLNHLANEWTFSASPSASGGFTAAALTTISTESGYNSSATSGQKTVRAGQQYTLSESSTPSGYTAAAAWSCDGGTFVSPDKITLALNTNVTCRMVNDDNVPTRTLKTFQKWVLHDRVEIVGYNDPGAGNRGNVDFKLFSNATCTTQVGSTENVTVDGAGKAATSTGVLVTSPGTYYWQVFFHHDDYNADSQSSCTQETTTITRVDDTP